MADTKKEQERAELFGAIWKIADKLRGTIDGWDFKQYVLGMMFYRYISENFTAYVNELMRGKFQQPSFDYVEYSDEDAERGRETLAKATGLFILPSELFCNVLQKAEALTKENKTAQTAATVVEKANRQSKSTPLLEAEEETRISQANDEKQDNKDEDFMMKILFCAKS